MRNKPTGPIDPARVLYRIQTWKTMPGMTSRHSGVYATLHVGNEFVAAWGPYGSKAEAQTALERVKHVPETSA